DDEYEVVSGSEPGGKGKDPMKGMMGKGGKKTNPADYYKGMGLMGGKGGPSAGGKGSQPSGGSEMTVLMGPFPKDNPGLKEKILTGKNINIFNPHGVFHDAEDPAPGGMGGFPFIKEGSGGMKVPVPPKPPVPPGGKKNPKDPKEMMGKGIQPE